MAIDIAALRAKAAAKLAAAQSEAAKQTEISATEENRNVQQKSEKVEVHAPASLPTVQSEAVPEKPLVAVAATATGPTPLSNAEQILGKIADLQVALQTAAPGYEGLLHTIHVALHKDEDVVHLLTEEQIGIICAGLAKKKSVVIAVTSSKGGGSKTPSGKKIKDLDVADI